MARKILVLLSEWGVWGEEAVGPVEALDAKGYELTFATAKGNRPHALPPSMTVGYFDPPLMKVVTDEYMALHTTQLDKSTRLDNPVNLSQWFPERPFFNAENFGHELERYYTARDKAWEDMKNYDALLIVLPVPATGRTARASFGASMLPVMPWSMTIRTGPAF